MADSVSVQILAADPQPVYAIAERLLGRRVSNQTVRTWSSSGKGRRGVVLPVIFGLGGTRLTTVDHFRRFWADSESHTQPELSPRERAGVSDDDAADALRALGMRPAIDRRGD